MHHIIGIDCAAQDRKCGLALGVLQEQGLQVLDVAHGLDAIMPRLVAWVGAHTPVLLAMDAPLGWPAPLGEALAEHRAGEAIRPSADELFHRHTDRVVWKETGKRPMEVGADRIARTAARAVNVLAELRDATGEAIPLAWEAGPQPRSAAIEVYPATTLRSRGMSDSGYKGRGDERVARRAEMVRELGELMDLPAGVGALAEPDSPARPGSPGKPDPLPDSDPLVDSDDALDAVLCLLAGADFLEGEVVAPDDVERARREGWIWFRKG